MNAVHFLLKQVLTLSEMEKQEFAQLFEESRKNFVFKRKRAKKVGFATQEEIIANLRKRGIWKDEQYWQQQKEK